MYEILQAAATSRLAVIKASNSSKTN